MGCGCNKRRAAAGGTATVPGTFRVVVNNRTVYETTDSVAADLVADRYDGATILKPGQPN